MKAQKFGKIVNIASLGARTGRPGVGINYAASKSAVIGITQTLARELGPDGIYVNAICPGPILTEQTKQYPPEVFASWNVGRAILKDGLPEDVADSVVFLASDRSAWITGVTGYSYPGGMVPEHKHDTEEEVMYFLSGKGKFITKDREIDLHEGICIYNPPGETHKIVNTGDEVLKFVWIYSPQLESHRKK